MKRRFPYIAFAAAVALSMACANNASQGALRLRNDISFEAANGQIVLRIAPDGDKVRVEDGDGAVLVTLALEAGGISILNARNEHIGTVLPPSEESAGYTIVGAGAPDTLFELRREPDGDFKVFDEAANVLYQAKLRDYGFKLVDRDGKARLRVRAQETKTSLRDNEGVTFMTTRDDLSTVATAALALEDLRFAYAVAFSVALHHWEPEP